MSAPVFLALDIGGSKLASGLVDAKGKVLQAASELWASVREENVIKTVLNAAKRYADEFDVAAVGVNIPGLAAPEAGIWVEACFSGIRNVPIRQLLCDELRLPVFIDNDVNNCALAESMFGVCKGVSDFAWLTVSNGCGGALFLNGCVYGGVRNTAGEFGHIIVEESEALAFPCGCGNYGCLEAQAAGPGILKRYLSLGGEEAASDGKPMDAREIAVLANARDPIAKKVYEDEGIYIGRALAAVINAVNPQKVVIGGGVSAAFELFWPTLCQTIKERTYGLASSHVNIEKTGLNYNAALIGAAALAMKGCGIF